MCYVLFLWYTFVVCVVKQKRIYLKYFVTCLVFFVLLNITPIFFSNSSLSFPLSYYVFSTSPCLCLSLLLHIRNGIYPMTAFGLPCPQQPQQETVKSPIVIPLVKSPTPEPAELETRRVRATECTPYITKRRYNHNVM